MVSELVKKILPGRLGHSLDAHLTERQSKRSGMT